MSDVPLLPAPPPSCPQTAQALPSYNVFGPTEATIITTMGVFTSANLPGGIHIGRPNTNTHCYIVDSNLRPVPPGVPGELLLSGPRLAHGYVGRPDLTEDKFVPNPCLSLVEGSIPEPMRPFFNRAYRTGGWLGGMAEWCDLPGAAQQQ